MLPYSPLAKRTAYTSFKKVKKFYRIYYKSLKDYLYEDSI